MLTHHSAVIPDESQKSRKNLCSIDSFCFFMSTQASGLPFVYNEGNLINYWKGVHHDKKRTD